MQCMGVQVLDVLYVVRCAVLVELAFLSQKTWLCYAVGGLWKGSSGVQKRHGYN